MLAAGAYISVTGIAAPITVVGTALGGVCTGLLYTLDIGTTSGKGIGYQIIGGVGWGIASQIPIITVQATAPAADLAEVTADAEGRLSEHTPSSCPVSSELEEAHD